MNRLGGTPLKSYIRLSREIEPFTPIDGEEWRSLSKEIEVSNHGRVRMVLTIPLRGRVTRYKGKTCYQQVKIGGKHYFVHRLIAEAFLGPCPIGHTVNHKDGNKLNNAPENLEYLTPQGNVLHAFERGLQAPRLNNAYIRQRTRLTETQVRQIRELAATGMKSTEVAAIVGCKRMIAWQVMTERSWRWLK